MMTKTKQTRLLTKIAGFTFCLTSFAVAHPNIGTLDANPIKPMPGRFPAEVTPETFQTSDCRKRKINNEDEINDENDWKNEINTNFKGASMLKEGNKLSYSERQSIFCKGRQIRPTCENFPLPKSDVSWESEYIDGIIFPGSPRDLRGGDAKRARKVLGKIESYYINLHS